MDLDSIIKYQELDQKIYRDEVNLARSPEAAKIAALKQQVTNAKNMLIKLNKDAEDCFNEISSVSEQLEKLGAKNKAILNVSYVNEINDADTAEDSLVSYMEQLTSYENTSKKAFKKLADINMEAAKQFEIGRNCNAERTKLQNDYMVKLNAVYEQNKEQKEQMNKLKENIPENVLNLYSALREAKKMPAFVEYNNGNCSACGMHIQIEVDAKLKTRGDYAECPNCRRIVYLK